MTCLVQRFVCENSRMPRFLYTLLLYLLLPFVPFRLLWRSLKQPEYLEHVGERFGFYPARPNAPVIWLHCVSVGETRAAAPLVHELQKRYPQHQILLTHATPTGRAAGEQLFGDSLIRCYLPYDLPGAVSRFLKHFEPKTGLLMETELWFNLIAACKKREIPLLLVNARLSDRSAAGYAKIASLTRQGLKNLAAVAAQTEQDASRLRMLGASRVEVLGNLKFDVEPPADATAQGEALRKLFGEDRPVFLSASTREGEEALILDAVSQMKIPHLLTVIVPRHPQRFNDVAGLLEKRGVAFARRSELSSAIGLDTQVVLGDSMGEMFTYYAACDVAFIGGSLLPLGGQNLIEAAAMGKPVLIGPHTFNFSDATELAVKMGAAVRVADAADLARVLSRIFSQPEECQTSRAAFEFSRGAGGAAQRIADLLKRYIS